MLDDKTKTNLNILITGVVFLVTGWGIMMDSRMHVNAFCILVLKMNPKRNAS